MSGEKDKQMTPATLLETNRRLCQLPLVCTILICLDGYETAYPDVAIECGLMSNSSGIWQTGATHIAHSVIFHTETQTKLIWIVGSYPVTKST